MIRFEKTAKVSSKGQITLPKPIRDLLNSDFVRLVVEDGEVRLEPAPELAGSLARYAKDRPVENEREAAWEAELRDRYPNRRRQRHPPVPAGRPAELSPKAKRFFDAVRSGEQCAFLPDCVLVECVYVMQRIYAVPRDEIAEKLTTLLGFRGSSTGDVVVLRKGLALYAESKVSFVDALIAATAAARGWPVETFDQDLRKPLAR